MSSGKTLSPIPAEAQPVEAGWTIFVNQDDPNKEAYKDIFAPLAERRGMIKPGQPIEQNWFEIENEVIKDRNWDKWLSERYLWMSRMERPRYVLLLGDTHWLPLGFQIDMSINAFVGRLAFDELDDYNAYVRKILFLESQDSPIVENQVLFVAPEFSLNKHAITATQYSCQFLVAGLMNSVNQLGIDTIALFGKDATKNNFLHALKHSNPAVVFVAGPGLYAATSNSLDDLGLMHKLNGAICFPEETKKRRSVESFSAEDVDSLPPEEPLFYGSVVYQFSSFGYGMSAASDFSIWKDRFQFVQPEEEFIAALPKKLVAHPKGPVAYIGQLDLALINSLGNAFSFDREALDPRLASLKITLEEMLSGHPPAYSIWELKEHYMSIMNYQLNVLKRTDILKSWNEKEKSKYVDRWLMLNDSKNYMIFGDPAARSSLIS